MRCSHCDFENLPGVATCQVCSSPLTGTACQRCGFENPPDYRFCGGCGQSLVGPNPAEPATEVFTVRAPGPRRTPPDSVSAPDASSDSGPPPIALIGFGAVLALGSIAFPWYLFGATQGSEEQSLSNILESGWRWFPGVPLVLIALSTIISTLGALVPTLTRARPFVAVVAGMVTLVSATWLWQGYSAPAVESDVLEPTTGAMLATVGAIILVAAGLWMLRSLRSR